MFLPKHKAFSREKISKIRLVDDVSFKQTPPVDESILSEIHQKFRLNTRRDDQLNVVWKTTNEDQVVDVDAMATQIEKRSKKKMDALSSKAAPTPQCPPPSLVAPKATGAMAHVSRRAVSKKQQPSSTTDHLRELSETDDDEDGLVFRKCKVAPPLDDTFMPQVKKVKPIPQALPPSTQPCISKWEKKGAQWTKRLVNEQVDVAAAHDPQYAKIPPIREQTSTVQQFEHSLRRTGIIHLKKKKITKSNDDMDDEVPLQAPPSPIHLNRFVYQGPLAIDPNLSEEDLARLWFPVTFLSENVYSIQRRLDADFQPTTNWTLLPLDVEEEIITCPLSMPKDHQTRKIGYTKIYNILKNIKSNIIFIIYS